MKKIAFILEREENSGKTSTIREVVKIIEAKIKEAQIKDISNQVSSATFVPLSEYVVNEEKEITGIIKINDKITIGIQSYGDYYTKITRAIGSFNRAKCKIILCAVRINDKNNTPTNGKTLSKIVEENLSKRKYNNIIQIPKIQTEDKCNEKSAELIYELIEKAIKELSE